MGCQQWQPFAYTRAEAIQTLLASDGKLIDLTQKTALARLCLAVSALQRSTTIAGGENAVHNSGHCASPI